VFLNLLANAIDHAPGTASVDVVVRRAGTQAIVEVSDQGAGVPPEDLATMFDAYARTGPSRRPSGLGLGLFVSREIVTAHGGEIRAASRMGEGTTITVRLPIGSPASRAGQAPKKAKTAKTAMSGGKTGKAGKADGRPG
jgi:signal transduction histidine kinase